jgi:hypothetical protein
MQPTISATSRDGKQKFVTPNGDQSRGVWIDADASPDSVKFAEPVVIGKLMAAPWGAGKGVKGGAAALTKPRVPNGYTDPTTLSTQDLRHAIAYARAEAFDGTLDMQRDVRAWLEIAEAELQKR